MNGMRRLAYCSTLSALVLWYFFWPGYVVPGGVASNAAPRCVEEALSTSANIWISGLPRSGTDWVARVVTAVRSASSNSSAARLLREPFNIDCTAVCPGLPKEEVVALRKDFVGHFPWLSGNATLEEEYARAIDVMLRRCGTSSVPPTNVVLKDPIGFYSTPWAVERYNCRAIITVRNPFSWVASMQKAGYTGNHMDCKHGGGRCGQVQLLRRLSEDLLPRLSEQAEKPAKCCGASSSCAKSELLALAHAAELQVAAAAGSNDALDALVALYSVFMATARLFAAQHPSYTFVRWEDLILRPEEAWNSVFGRPSEHEPVSDLNDGKERSALDNVLRETMQAKAADQKGKFATRRDSWSELFDWQGSLDDRTLAIIAERTRRAADAFYPEPFWWDGAFATATRAPPFLEVTAEAALATQAGPGMGFAWGDVNNDGYLDLFLGYHFDAVYRSEPDRDYPEPTFFLSASAGGLKPNARRTFQPRRISALANVPVERCRASPCLNLTIPADYHGAAFVDFDNDGDEDLVVATGGGAAKGRSPHLLLENDGSGRFKYRKNAFPELAQFQRGRFGQWGDWNGDGRLDVVIQGAARPEPSLDSMAFVQVQRRQQHSLGDVTVNERVFDMVNDNPMHFAFKSRLPGRAAHALALDHGGKRGAWVPVVANGPDPAKPWQLRLSEVQIADDKCVVTCHAWYAGHGNYCCVYESFFAQTQQEKQQQAHEKDDNGMEQLKRLLEAERPSKEHLVTCALAEDFDNDGDVDLMVVYFHSIRSLGHEAVPDLQRTLQYVENVGFGKGFRRWPTPPVLFDDFAQTVSSNVDCCASVDFDNDGRMDVFLTTAPFLWYLDETGETFETALKRGTFDPSKWKFPVGAPTLLRNRQAAGNWVKVVPVGDGIAVPRQAIGTKISVSVGQGAAASVLQQTYTDGVMVFAQGDRRLHFGLGEHETVNSITVIWQDGRKDTVAPKAVNCLVRVVRNGAGTVELQYEAYPE